jgi:hypothetical protein
MGRTKKLLCAVAVCATAVVGVGASAAFAGEVTGPPGTPNEPFSGSGRETGARINANSICAFNGLNDMNPMQGQIEFITQTPGNQALFPGEAGHGACRGGTNDFNRQH